MYNKRDLKKVVVWGTFDNLHDGHREFLRQVSRLGAVYAIVVPDEAVLENKGRLPIFSAEVRAMQLRKLPFIADVRIDSWRDGLESLRTLQPHYFGAGYDQNEEWENLLLQFCKECNLRISFVRFSEYAGGIHSSHLRFMDKNDT